MSRVDAAAAAADDDDNDDDDAQPSGQSALHEAFKRGDPEAVKVRSWFCGELFVEGGRVQAPDGRAVEARDCGWVGRGFLQRDHGGRGGLQSVFREKGARRERGSFIMNGLTTGCAGVTGAMAVHTYGYPWRGWCLG